MVDPSVNAEVDRTFTDEVHERAKQVASRYTIIVQPEQNGKYYGRSLEMPGVFDCAVTAEACTKNIYDSLTFAVATLLEQGQEPPRPACVGIRDAQINIRVSNYEKFLIDAAAERVGARGASDFVRTAAMERASKEFPSSDVRVGNSLITDELVIEALNDRSQVMVLHERAVAFLEQIATGDDDDSGCDVQVNTLIGTIDNPPRLVFPKRFVESDGRETVHFEDILEPLRGVTHPARRLRASLRQILVRSLQHAHRAAQRRTK